MENTFPLPASISPSLHPQYIGSLLEQSPNDTKLKTMHSAIVNLYDTMIDVVEAHEKNMSDPMKSEMANLKATLDHIDKVTPKAIEAAEKALETAGAALNPEGKSPKDIFSQSDEYAAETRVVVRGLNTTERRTLLMTAINDKNLTVLSAILGAPSHLSGLTQSESDGFVREYMLKHDPAKRDMNELADRAKMRLGIALQSFKSTTASIVDRKALEEELAGAEKRSPVVA